MIGGVNMWFVFYLLGVLIAYIILMGVIYWDDTTEFTKKDKIKCFIISLFSWIIVIFYLVLAISAYIMRKRLK